MAYQQEKDKLIKLFELKNNDSSLMLSIFSYDGGKAKLGFSRTFKKKDDTMGYSSIGRMSLDEIKFLKDNINEIIEIIEKQNN